MWKLLVATAVVTVAISATTSLGDKGFGGGVTVSNSDSDSDSVLDSYKGIYKDSDTESTTTTTTMKSSFTAITISEALDRSLAGEIDPKLSFSDMNIMVVSDVHSHVGGHPHEKDRNADYGDLFSFHQRLEEHCEEKHMGDLWLFNNGDILHGTGLAMDGNATNLFPILNSMPWDALTMGRQEATYSDVLRDMNETFLPNFPGKYITSNVVWAGTNEPYGARYQLLRGRNSTLLVLGFLYDTVSTSQTIQVLSIEETIQQEWFRAVLRQEETNPEQDEGHYDAIVVMAHMDIDSPSIEHIHKEIRSNVDPQMPIQFIAGHSHKRAKRRSIRRDPYAHAMEPGGLFDTIGWVTIPKFDFAKRFPSNGKSPELEDAFWQEMLNTSKTHLRSSLGMGEDRELRTEEGTAVSAMIRDTRERLGLNQIVACPPHDYYRNISIHEKNSLWKLWKEHVVRTEIFQKDEDRVMLVSKGSMRYDLLGSGKHDHEAMTLDDVVAIAPYMEKVVYVGDVPDYFVRRLNNSLNSDSMFHHRGLPDYVMAGDMDEIVTAESYKLYTHEVDVPRIKKKLDAWNWFDYEFTDTGQRDTLYWLDYVRSAFPCKGSEKETFEVPYFYDPNELEEEKTDGTLSSEDIETDDAFEKSNNNNKKNENSSGDLDDEVTWTLPPDDGYQGYVPAGKHETVVIPSSKYETYKSKDEKARAKQQAAQEAASKISGKKDLTTQRMERKKTHKKVIRGFSLALAGLVLLVPVVCLVLQLTGRNDYYDNYDDRDARANGLYDPEEMKLLKRNRRRGVKPSMGPLHSAPFKEIEII
jgi:hypothetical protein